MGTAERWESVSSTKGEKEHQRTGKGQTENKQEKDRYSPVEPQPQEMQGDYKP